MTLTTRAADCPVCSNPTSTAKQRWRCRKQSAGACKVPPRATGRKPLSAKERKARRRAVQQKYWASIKGRLALRRRQTLALREREPLRLKMPLASQGQLEGAATTAPLLSTLDVSLPVDAQSEALPVVPASAPVSPRRRVYPAVPFEPCLRCFLKRKGDLYSCAECPDEYIPLRHMEGCPNDTRSVQGTLERLEELQEAAAEEAGAGE